MTYQVHVRSQHRKMGRGPFGGPDTYVAVTVAPEGVGVPYYLNSAVLAKRGIEIRYFGEGYAEHSGSKSALGKAIAAAEEFCRWKREQEAQNVAA